MSNQAKQLRALMDAVTSASPETRVSPDKLVDAVTNVRVPDRVDVAVLREADELVALLRAINLIDDREL